MVKKEIVVLSGASGSGISSAKYVFEELGFYIIENSPFEVLPYLLDALKYRIEKRYCFIINNVSDVYQTLKICKTNKNFETKLILLCCDKETILKRFALTRHIHARCVNEKISLEKAIELDDIEIHKLIEKADICIDTSNLTVKKLRIQLYGYLNNIEENKMMHVTFISFGLKNGIPQGLDNIIDVRVIPNPYWIEELRPLTGLDKKVIDYMESFEITKKFLNHVTDYLSFYFSSIQEENRANYNVGVACSGGQHRSTYVANYLAKYFAKDYSTSVIHRDTPELNER